jgi:hypothetical protein
MRFDYGYAYEDRPCLHTSRWSMEGVKLTEDGNAPSGRLWLTCEADGQTVTVELYRDRLCDPGDLIASGQADLSEIADGAVRCDLAPANQSGLSGEFYLESYLADPPGAVEVLVSLCTEADLSALHTAAGELPVRDEDAGLAQYCALATRNVLLLVSQRYADRLGGCGAPEHRNRDAASRSRPDFRRLANVDQLKDAAAHWALALAFGACHQRADETMYSHLRDYHDARRREAVQAWNLTLNADPDIDDDADTRRPSGFIPITRT